MTTRISSIKILSTFLIWVLTLSVLGPANIAQADDPSDSMPGPEIVLVADENNIPLHVPAPPLPGGLGVQSVPFTVNYNPATCDGTVTDWPADAQIAFDYAVAVWAELLDGPHNIVIDACWRTDMSLFTLGSAGATSLRRNFTGAPMADTWYSISLANQLAGYDLNGSTSEIKTNFNSSANWYYGTDNNPPFNRYDFVSVVLHEVGHGLGFSGFMNVDNGSGSDECNGEKDYGCWGYYSGGFATGTPKIYDRFTENGGGQNLITSFANPSTGLGTQLTSNNIYFDGPNANAANGGTPPKLYAPATWRSGSSFSHLDPIYDGTAHALMTHSLGYGESIHHPGSITLGILKDIGWSIASDDPEPDLHIPSLTADDTSICTGTTVDFSANIHNQGNSSAPANYLYYYDGTSSNDFSNYVGQDDVSGLAAGSSSLKNFSYTFNTAGTRYFNIRADATNQVDENNEANNNASIPISVAADTSDPTGSIFINGGDTYATSQDVTLTLNADDDGDDSCNSGLDQMKLYYNGSWHGWESYAAGKSVTLSGTGTQYVYVQYKDNAENTSALYNDSIIIDLTAPAAPTLSLPANGSTTTDNTPYFDWNSVSGAAQYQLQVDNNADFTSPEINTYSTDSYYQPGALSDGLYYWQVRARDAAGNWSSWSDAWTVMIDTIAPNSSVTAPNGTTISSSFTVQWGASESGSGLKNYDIQYNDNNSGWVNWQVNTTAISATFNGAQVGHTYYFRSRARDNAGNLESYPSTPDYDTRIIIQSEEEASSYKVYLPTIIKAVN